MQEVWMSDFIVGKVYTRDQIHELLGGSKQSYLPTVNNHVVCACLTKQLNPDGPFRILVGSGPIVVRSAELLVEQGGSIPVFVKQRVNEWRYTGLHSVERYTTDAKEI